MKNVLFVIDVMLISYFCYNYIFIYHNHILEVAFLLKAIPFKSLSLPIGLISSRQAFFALPRLLLPSKYLTFNVSHKFIIFEWTTNKLHSILQRVNKLLTLPDPKTSNLTFIGQFVLFTLLMLLFSKSMFIQHQGYKRFYS